MKRYFFIPDENLGFDIIVNEKAMELTLDDLKITTNILNLEEITEEKYNRLKDLV